MMSYMMSQNRQSVTEIASLSGVAVTSKMVKIHVITVQDSLVAG